MENVRLFRNWTNEDFSWAWNGERYDFPAKSARYLPEYLADHFAKHLTDREMHKAGQPTDMPIRAEFLAKCMNEEETFQVQNAEIVEAEIKNKEEDIAPIAVSSNEPVAEQSKPRRGRPPKIV